MSDARSDTRSAALKALLFASSAAGMLCAAPAIAAADEAAPADGVISQDATNLGTVDVQVDELGPAGDRFRYRYSGLRKLIRSDQLMLLLPVEWRQGRDRVFIVPDGEGVRLDVIAPPRPGPDAAG